MRRNTKMIFATVLPLTAVFSVAFSVFSYTEGKDRVTGSNVHDRNMDENRINENVERVKKLLKEKHMDENRQRKLRKSFSKNKEFIVNLRKLIADKKPEWANLSPSEQIDKLIEEMSHSFVLSNDGGSGGGPLIETDMDEGTIRDLLKKLGSSGKEIYYQNIKGQWIPLSSVSL
ncbi:hypothetical protein [Pasteuria penetrans]|uniref:hypothetical protein n=1 Tax=Pasteuria penetrans TaxID=86005 RepID=UPI0011EE8898|nr:hypothetical protein [Pasteuria penetrans]